MCKTTAVHRSESSREGEVQGETGCLLFRTGSETSRTGVDVGISFILVCLLERVSEKPLSKCVPVLQPCNPLLDLSVAEAVR